eukprot:TRINITY_DN7293_c0_g1_i2.p1 TRINITY_DN7293_c0_g1~~TRINITY_DN7293_c0_g1_i2.p1  ORF type:complete len:665 (+),score=112.91 TRINITY_DN7293_c0_g1_i2:165-2159(+)
MEVICGRADGVYPAPPSGSLISPSSDSGLLNLVGGGAKLGLRPGLLTPRSPSNVSLCSSTLGSPPNDSRPSGLPSTAPTAPLIPFKLFPQLPPSTRSGSGLVPSTLQQSTLQKTRTIYVRTPDIIPIKISQQKTVGDVKALLEKAIGIPADRIELFFDGRLLHSKEVVFMLLPPTGEIWLKAEEKTDNDSCERTIPLAGRMSSMDATQKPSESRVAHTGGNSYDRRRPSNTSDMQTIPSATWAPSVVTVISDRSDASSDNSQRSTPMLDHFAPLPQPTLSNLTKSGTNKPAARKRGVSKVTVGDASSFPITPSSTRTASPTDLAWACRNLTAAPSFDMPAAARSWRHAKCNDVYTETGLCIRLVVFDEVKRGIICEAYSDNVVCRSIEDSAETTIDFANAKEICSDSELLFIGGGGNLLCWDLFNDEEVWSSTITPYEVMGGGGGVFVFGKQTGDLHMQLSRKSPERDYITLHAPDREGSWVQVRVDEFHVAACDTHDNVFVWSTAGDVAPGTFIGKGTFSSSDYSTRRNIKEIILHKDKICGLLASPTDKQESAFSSPVRPNEDITYLQMWDAATGMDPNHFKLRSFSGDNSYITMKGNGNDALIAIANMASLSVFRFVSDSNSCNLSLCGEFLVPKGMGRCKELVCAFITFKKTGKKISFHA